jgi:hypothetical protein
MTASRIFHLEPSRLILADELYIGCSSRKKATAGNGARSAP